MDCCKLSPVFRLQKAAISVLFARAEIWQTKKDISQDIFENLLDSIRDLCGSLEQLMTILPSDICEYCFHTRKTITERIQTILSKYQLLKEQLKIARDAQNAIKQLVENY